MDTKNDGGGVSRDADSLRSSRLRGQFRTALSPLRREGRKETLVVRQPSRNQNLTAETRRVAPWERTLLACPGCLTPCTQDACPAPPKNSASLPRCWEQHSAESQSL